MSLTEKHIGNNFLNWQENAEENSSFNAKSSEESVATQEYDSAYGSEKLRGGTYGKEPSYVEDSLLMSMFGEGEDPESKEKSDNSISSAMYENRCNRDVGLVCDNYISIPRYSSDLPTMVGMTGGTGSTVNYQGRFHLFPLLKMGDYC